MIPGYSDIWSDVWRSDDLGETWSQILANGDDTSWSGRAYFQTMVQDGEMLMIGGQDYRLVENPTDLWWIVDGVEWTLDDETPWIAEDPSDIRYDFDSITADGDGNEVIMTFNGDCETFDFEDPDNCLRVDSDVWPFGP